MNTGLTNGSKPPAENETIDSPESPVPCVKRMQSVTAAVGPVCCFNF